MKKILVIRFSSIGDIVLITPVIRAIKTQLSGCLVHVVTKEVFSDVLKGNPYTDKLYTFQKDVSELYTQLKNEHYDLVIDLHKNLRSLRLKQKLGVKSYAFNKLNLKKFLAVQFKLVNQLPSIHIVDRYFESVKPLSVVQDGKGLDYFITKTDEINVSEKYFNGISQPFIALVVGGSYYTKQIPYNKLKEICGNTKLPIVLIGGKGDIAVSSELCGEFPTLIDTCGKLNLGQSASVIKSASWVITSDTGMMHVAAAFEKPIISVWGNTIPEFGMGPYMPNPKNKILEIKDLGCRPCSKLGYKKCPKGHFKCMNEIDFSFLKNLQ